MKTLLDLVAHQCWSVDENIAQLSQELSAVKRASKIDLKDLKAKVTRLSSDIVRLDGNYKRVVETTSDINVSIVAIVHVAGLEKVQQTNNIFSLHRTTFLIFSSISTLGNSSTSFPLFNFSGSFQFGNI